MLIVSMFWQESACHIKIKAEFSLPKPNWKHKTLDRTKYKFSCILKKEFFFPVLNSRGLEIY